MMLATVAYSVVTNVLMSVSGNAVGCGKFIPCSITNATPNQEIVIVAEQEGHGHAQITWKWNDEKGHRPSQVKYPDITSPGHETVTRVRPMWLAKAGEKISGIMISGIGFTPEVKKMSVEDIRLKEPIDAGKIKGVSFSLKTTKQGRGRVRWMVEGERELRSAHFEIPPDGKVHRRSLDLSGERGWRGKIFWCDFVDSDTRPLDVRDVEFSDAAVQFKPEIAISDSRIADYYPRVGTKVPVETIVLNTGTAPLKNVRVNNVTDGVDIEPGDVALLSFSRDDFEAGPCEIPISVTADNAAEVKTVVRGRILPSLGLEKASYVPEPKPVEGDYEIGAVYFPGWTPAYRRGTAWKAVWHTNPQRKPVLGWYDEGEPEAVDWHLKYLAENGINFLLVDWYWNLGRHTLHHFIDAYYKARYRKNVKWAVFWCNHHNPPCHSTNDFENVATFWCTNYFNTSEYYTIDGKPVVAIYSSENIERDMGAGNCPAMLDIMRNVAKKHGFKDIHFVAMKWNERDTNFDVISKYKARGFDATTIYHYIDHDGKTEDPLVFPYSATVNANIDVFWNGWYESSQKAGIGFIPHISTGWDDTPWTENRRIYGKTVDGFRTICKKAKEFCDRNGVKRFVISPLNEWGEGSYCEPNGEYGFGFYETIREIFCKKPEGGWPLNYTPKDVGLGPYAFRQVEK